MSNPPKKRMFESKEDFALRYAAWAEKQARKNRSFWQKMGGAASSIREATGRGRRGPEWQGYKDILDFAASACEKCGWSPCSQQGECAPHPHARFLEQRWKTIQVLEDDGTPATNPNGTPMLQVVETDYKGTTIKKSKLRWLKRKYKTKG